jgi:4-aminobutyrate aminotransferase-like enzyme/Ser/Thr protein kinase RdoA (MazF antagonist)
MPANPFLEHELRAPRLQPADALAVAGERFGVGGTAQKLDSHQDQNFRIDTPDARYVLKVANPAFARAELEMQNRAMEHVAGALPGAVPVPVRARDGMDVVGIERAGTRYDVRLLSYLEGEPLRNFGHFAPGTLREAGRLAGRVAAALASFHHPAADRTLQWDIRQAADVVCAFTPEVRDGRRRALVERTIERAAGALEGLDPGLRRQVIHGDVTEWNVVARRNRAAQAEPHGLIDFGDVTRSWLAAECAVLAAAVARRPSARALQDAVEVVRGFHSAMPLLEDEVAALPALMAARAALSAVGSDRQAALEPDNPYVLGCVDEGWRLLATIAAIPPPLAHASFREVCGLPPLPSRPAPSREGAGPVVEGLDGRTAVPLDLSVGTDALRFGAWREPATVATAAARAAGSSPGAIPVGRYGERRMVHERGPEQDEPATVHLGADLFLPEGTPVLAPLGGHVVRAGARELLLAVEDGFTLRLAGIVPAQAEGVNVGRGERVGNVAAPDPNDRLPAHLHVQLACAPLEELPGLVPASLAEAWLTLCPDPGPLLGMDDAARREPPEAVLARRRRFVAAAHLLYYPSTPPQIERGWRQWLYDAHGRPYLDVINNIAILGHSHPRVEAVAARQLRLLNTNTRFLYDAMGRFAERLAGIVPDPLEVVFLLNSGSEANDLALRLAREVTGRCDVISLEGCYHGWTAATDELLAAAREPAGAGEGRSPRAHPVVRPNPYTGPYRADDPRAANRYSEHVRELVDRLMYADRPPAAFISEPVLGSAGGVLPPVGYLRQVYDAIRAAGGLCIADEVQVGYGRLGHHFWAFEQQGVVPDIVTIAKPAGNGHPVAVVITTRAIADEFARHTDFFASVGGGPVSCEIGLAVLDVIEQERLQENAREVGDHLERRLSPLVDRHPLVGALHGMGLYRGLELVRDREARSPASEEAHAICERLRELGVIVQPTGPGANVLKLKPPLCITRDDIDFLASALERTLDTGW